MGRQGPAGGGRGRQGAAEPRRTLDVTLALAQTLALALTLALTLITGPNPSRSPSPES